MPRTFCLAPEVEEIGRDLIELHHSGPDPEKPSNLALPGVRVEFVFCSDVPTRNGKAIWGTARKITSLAAFFAGSRQQVKAGDTQEPFFCITISRPIWLTLDYDKRRALVDHELCHCVAAMEEDKAGDEVLVLSIRPHDLEEFSDIVQRHGLWRRDVCEFVKVASQQSIPFNDEDDS